MISKEFVFPQDEEIVTVNDEEKIYRCGGLTKRELYAVVILNGLIVAGASGVLVTTSIRLADDLIRELDK